jgi:glycosyltransferase involved in cell wall biosynthesis
MNLMVFMKLGDKHVIYHLISLLRSDLVNDLFLLRDDLGPPLQKVTYYPTPEFIKRHHFMLVIYKILLGLAIGFFKNVDYIHSYLLFPHGLFALLVAKILRKKVGVTIIAGPIEVFIKRNVTSQNYSYNKPLPQLTLSARFQLALLKKYDVITCSGSFTKKTLIGYGVDPDKITIVQHMIPQSIVTSEHVPFSKKHIDILYLGRLAKLKHVETIIKAVNILKKDFPNLNCTIVGDGPEKKALHTLVKRYSLENNVFLVGYKRDVWYYYSNAKMTVLMSEREGFPLVVLESMSCGTPVIVTKCGDIIDVIKNDYNGYLLDDYLDHKTLSRKIRSLLNDEKKLKKISENTLKTIKQMDLLCNTKKWNNILEKYTRN